MLTYSSNSEHPWTKNLANELATGCTGPRIKKTSNNENKRTRKIVIIIVMKIIVIIVL